MAVFLGRIKPSMSRAQALYSSMVFRPDPVVEIELLDQPFQRMAVIGLAGLVTRLEQ